MAKPSDDPTWASDANYASDGDSWEATPTRVDPGAARVAEGAEPDTFPAQWFNFITGVQGDHIDYINDVLEGSDSIPANTQTSFFGPECFRKKPEQGDEGSKWRHEFETNSPFEEYWETDGSSGNAVLWASLKGCLPDGAIITRMRVLVLPGATAVGAAAMTAILRETGGFDLTEPPPTDFATSCASPTDLIVLGGTSDTAGVEKVLDSGAVSLTLDMAKGYRIEIKSGSGTAVDGFGWVHIEYTSPGPRPPV